MYGSILINDTNGRFQEGVPVRLGDIRGKDEAWLRDLLLRQPEIIPVDEIDPTYGPLIPLCRELRTNAGAVDAAFINKHGRLTIVECKLWRNPQARREVVAQSLHYVSAISEWTYADLQRQVAAALGRNSRSPYEIVRSSSARIVRESDFCDAVTRSLREGRVLVLLVGDGIREGIASLTDLINSSATKAFSFAMVEVAAYRFGRGSIAIQPRVLVETSLITRQITVLQSGSAGHRKLLHAETTQEETDDEAPSEGTAPSHGQRKKMWRKKWWRPLLAMKFDDPEQERPYFQVTNNLVLPTPFPGIRIKAFAIVDGPDIGVFVAGTRHGNTDATQPFIRRDKKELLDRLPKGTTINGTSGWPIDLRTDRFAKRPFEKGL
ncbi:MAG: hypothetical protein IT563_03920 [Alphaproteobacteria bacterium]|nr:hypothetical protein [Alphaproteobacteria bacterium]